MFQELQKIKNFKFSANVQWRFQSCQVTLAGDMRSRAAVTAEFLREAISTIHQNFTQAMPGSGTAYANVCRACMYFLIHFHAVDAVSSSGSL